MCKCRKKDDEQSILDLLVKAFVNGFLLKLLEKIGEKIGEWCAYRLIQHHDPEYYGTKYEDIDSDKSSESRSE